MLCPFGLQTRDIHGGNGQIVDVVKSSFNIFPCHDEVQKMQSNKMTKYKLDKIILSFSHIHNGVHTYIHNQKKCTTSEYFTTKL